MKEIELYVDNEERERLDLYLASKLDNISRTRIQKLIKKGLILVNNKKKKARYLLNKDDRINITIPKPKEIELLPENIQVDILYEDKYLIVVNKPQGMVVHPAPSHCSGTLVNALLYHTDKLSTIGDPIRPGIVHRLDKDTSGLLVVAKDNYSHKFLINQFKERQVKRRYITLVHGRVKNNSGIINKPIGRDVNNRRRMWINYKNGKEAISSYKVIERLKDYTFLEVDLKTGRTHQIRVHLSYINHPILGDSLYSHNRNKSFKNKQLLHALGLGFIHPVIRKYMEFETDIPNKFMEIINRNR